LPLYEYECPQCGVFERMQKFSDPILKTCPTCKKRVEKLLSAPAIQFKGTGWYVTDYSGRSSGGKDKDAKTGEAKGSSESKDSSDSKGTKDSTSATDTKKPSGAKKAADPKK